MAGPNYVGGNVVYFNAADQETNVNFGFRIRAIAWVSSEETDLDIATDDDMLLEDGAGNKIIGKRAEGAGDGLELSFPGNGVTVIGLKAEELDGGVLYVIGDKL